MKEHGQDFHSRHPVMTPEMIRQLPPGFALVIRGGMSPVIAKLPMVWREPIYRQARRARQAIARLVVQSEEPDWDIPDSVPDNIMDLGPTETMLPPAQPGNGISYPWDEDSV
jgi:hypothetical protein